MPTGAPVKWFSSQRSGNMYRAYVGETMAYTGSSDEGVIIVPAQSWYSSTTMFYNVYSIAGGELVTDSFLNTLPE